MLKISPPSAASAASTGDFLFVCLISDVTEVMGDQTGDQTDAELQNKGLGCIYDIDGIEKVADGHADGAADAAPETAKDQRAENTDGIAEMDACCVAAGKRDLNLQKSEDNIR